MHLLAPNIRGFIVHSKWYKELTIKYTQMPQDKVFLWAFPVLPSILQRPIVPTAARDIDVLVYAKFTDERHLEGLEAVMSRLNAAAIRSVLMSYGTFTRDQLLQTASRAKFCLSLSFFESGGIGQSEIACMGPYFITFPESFSLFAAGCGSFVPQLKQDQGHDQVIELLRMRS